MRLSVLGVRIRQGFSFGKYTSLDSEVWIARSHLKGELLWIQTNFVTFYLTKYRLHVCREI